MHHLEDNFLVVCTVVTALALTVQVVWRYIFNMPLTWSEELARYLYVWMTFFGMGYGVRKATHIRMLLLVNRAGPVMQTVMAIITDSVFFFLGMLFLPGTVEFFLDQCKVVSTGMKLNMGIVYISLPAGLGILLIYIAAEILKSIKTLIQIKTAKKEELPPCG